MAHRAIDDVTWRAQVASRVHELENDLARVRSGAPPDPEAQTEYDIAKEKIAVAHLKAADGPGLLSPTWLRRWASGSDVETAWNALHAAEAALVTILPAKMLKARLPEMRAALTTTLAGDGRLVEYTGQIDAAAKAAEITDEQREQLRVIRSAIDAASDAAHTNVRNYRNWLLIVSGTVTVGLIGLAVAHAVNPDVLYICQATKGVCAGGSGADLGQIEAAGALGGLLMALFALIRLTVYSGPVALPLWQALVRVPAGAAAALVGAFLLQGEVLSSITPQSRSGLLGYAVLFGAAPEVVLRFLDDKVNKVTAAARTENDPVTKVPAQTKADVLPEDPTEPKARLEHEEAEGLSAALDQFRRLMKLADEGTNAGERANAAKAAEQLARRFGFTEHDLT
jgi:hypothetical protein